MKLPQAVIYVRFQLGLNVPKNNKQSYLHIHNAKLVYHICMAVHMYGYWLLAPDLNPAWMISLLHTSSYFVSFQAPIANRSRPHTRHYYIDFLNPLSFQEKCPRNRDFNRRSNLLTTLHVGPLPSPQRGGKPYEKRIR